MLSKSKAFLRHPGFCLTIPLLLAAVKESQIESCSGCSEPDGIEWNPARPAMKVLNSAR